MEAYSKFDFDANPKFQEYINSIYPPQTNTEKYRRKWYKQNIDPSFDINQETPTQQEIPQEKAKQQQQQQQQFQHQQQQQQRPNAANLPLYYVIEGVLKVLYFPALLFLLSPTLNKYLNLGSVLICLMAIYRQGGRPQLNQLYFGKIIQLEFTTNLFYIILLFASEGSFAFQMPIAMHFLVGGAQFWCSLSQEDGLTLKTAKYIQRNRDEIVLVKQKIEIYLFLYSIVGVFIGKTSFFMALFLFQNLALKTKCNQNMRNAQAYVRVWYANNLSENPKLPAGMGKVFGLIWKGYEKIMTLI